jgi:hypothetical protein
MSNYISELYFMNISNHMVCSQHPYNNFLPELNIVNLKNNDIIYMYLKREVLNYFIFQVLPHITVNFKLITGLSDDTSPYIEERIKYEHFNILLTNKFLTRWYAINKDFDHPKMVAIPVGTLRSIPISTELPYLSWTNGNFGRDIMINYLDSINGNHLDLMNNKENLLYISYSTENQSNNICFFNIRPDLDEYLRINTLFEKQSLVYWEKYIIDMSKCKFNLIPPGTGIDNCRIIESIVLGTIPILFDHCLYRELYSDLPVLFIIDFSQINETYLNDQHEIIRNRKNYNFDKILKKYWIDRVLEDK